MVGKRVQFDEETWQALDMLADDEFHRSRAHDRSVDLKDVLKRSVKETISRYSPLPTW